MFGFLRSCYCDPAYRRAYCQTCRHLKTHYGPTALPFLSYEAAFLHALAADLGWLDTAGDGKCRRPLGPKVPHFTDVPDLERRVGEFSAAFTLLLVAVKMADDVRDGNSTAARAISAFYRRKFLKSRRFFRVLDADFDMKIARFIQNHHFLEETGVPRELTEYATPTAMAFSWIYTLFARHLNADARTAEWLREAGFLAGASLVQADCAWDWERDARCGDYSPVRTLHASAEAYGQSQENLRRLHALCTAELGGESLSAKTVMGVHDRLFYTARRDPRYHAFLFPKMSQHSARVSAACPTLILLAQQPENSATCTQFTCYVCGCCTCLSCFLGLCSPLYEERDGIPTTVVDACCSSFLCVQGREMCCGREEY